MELNFATCQILSRFLLPVLLLFVAVIRQNVFSGLYLILFFVSPFFPSPKVIRNQTNFYIKTVFTVTTLICTTHVLFQSYLLINLDFKNKLNDCDKAATILRIIGLHNLTYLSALNITRLFICDFVVLVIALIFFIITQRIYDSTTRQLDERLVNNDEFVEPIDSQHNELINDREDAHGEFYNRFRFPIDLSNTNAIQNKVKLLRLTQITKYFFEILFLILLGSCAILNPSILSFIYFFILLFILTWFGFNKQFKIFYVYLRIAVCVITVSHILLLFIYQLTEVNERIKSDQFIARLLGLTQYVDVICEQHYHEEIRVLNWNVYIHPILLCVLYLTTIYMVIYYFKIKKQSIYHSVSQTRAGYNDLDNTSNKEQEQTLSPSETTEQEEDSKKILSSDTPKKNNDNLKLNDKKFKTSTAPSSPSVFNTLQLLDFDRLSKFNILLNLLNLIKKGSYVGTLIVMMTWSITYHSWLGFILLIASCIIWMMPNSRQVCLKSSVFLIVYAIFLLISSYVFSLNLTDTELPKDVNGINLYEIGFQKDPYDLAYKSLFIKLLFTLVFYITLRQYMEENYLISHINDINISRPGEHHENVSFNEERHMSLAANYTFNDIDPMLNKTIRAVRLFLSKYWIIIVTLLLMVMSLSGKKVVLYRIVYMSLFLSFVLVFQISYRLWRKFIYLFWLILIVYSMAVLVAIYTYQFKDFKDYWQNYLGISPDWQESIGLEKYKHDDPLLLFNQLFTPTFFIIITIIQVHFFHQEFLQLSNLHQTGSFVDVQLSDSTQMTGADTPFGKTDELRKSSANSSNITDELNAEIKIDIEPDEDPKKEDESMADEIKEKLKHDKNEDKKNNKKMNKEFLVEEITSESPLFGISTESLIEIVWPTILHAYELFWRALELHMMKIVFICAIIAALDETSLINFVIIVLIAIGLPMKQFERIICHTLVIWTACLILFKMFYQLPVAKNVKWSSNCTTLYGVPNVTELYAPFNETIDNRLYIGFHVAENVLNIIYKDLIIVLVLTLNTLVYIRQTIVRFKSKEIPPKSDCLFIGVHRNDADENVIKLIKFMMNYWFYKFGLEVVAVFLVFAIAGRRDFIALIFSLFLFPITLLKRSTVKKLWPFIVIMQTFMLPIQYLLILGLPIGFCTEYPWSSYYLSPTIRQWLFLSDYQYPPDKNLLYYDFFVLMFFCRQMFVFATENQIRQLRTVSNRASIHSVQLDNNGGSNDELKDDTYSTTDPNIKDYFKTSNKTILDVFKTSFFSCFYWITLAILFMTANNRQNLFGLGYIVGCFVFLWNGNDFYLKNRRKVFKNWNYLIFYTWIVIVLKTVLTLIGCEHAEELFSSYCAIARLFGIDCQCKLVHDQSSIFIVDLKILDTNKDCPNSANYSNTLFWDAICLLFLIIQKRIFGSYYFNYLVIEIKAQQRLASRGAELIHEIQAKEYKEEKEEERELMGKIKAKMDIIRANQRKTIDSVDYKPKHHYQACRSGDYYMVDNPEGEVLDSEEKEKKSLIPDPIGDELRKYAEVRGFSAFCSNFVKGSFFEVSPEQTLHVGDSSKDSAIVSIDRSELKSSFSQRTRTTQQQASTDQPQPSTSTGAGSDKSSKDASDKEGDNRKSDEDGQKEDGDETKDSKRTESILYKIKKWLKIIKYFFISCLISATVKLNEVSRDYRYVSRRLAVEKKALKCIIHLKATPEAQKQLAEKISNARVPEIKTKTKKQRKTEIGDYEQDQSKLKDSKDEDLSELADYYLDYNVLMRFIFAIGYAIVSQSEILCYVFVIFNQMKNASLISLPLPLMVFLWGCLSLPRPSKTFWISLITYTEAIVVAKYMFKFNVLDWIKYDTVTPSWPNVPKNKEENLSNNSSYDLFLLLVLFFHRFMLKSLGLWDIDSIVTRFDEESEKDRLSTKSDLIIEKNKAKLILENQEIRKRKISNPEQQIDQQFTSTVNLNKLDNRPVPFNKTEKRTYYFAFFMPFQKFFNQLFRLSEYRIAKDFYAVMFLCDFINFFIVVFGYSSFGTTNTESTDITTYFREDRIPILFFVMLLIQFVIIIIDRALYLRKNIFYRLVFHISLVVIIHIWLFFVIPMYTGRNFTDNSAPMFWYIFKTIYLILSANQIKSGYPTRILGNCFTKKYTLLNLYLFKVYMAIPFLYDLRLIMDWIWTESSLDLNEWATMEDIFKQLFERKCEINYNDKFPYPRGEGRRRRNKFVMGGFYFMIVIIAIWFPLTLFAFGSQVGTPTKPVEVSIELEFSGYQPIFKMSGNQNSLLNLTDIQWGKLQNEFPSSSSQFLSYYNYEDVVLATINGNSFATWDVSPPNKDALMNSLNASETVIVKLTWRIKRKKKSQNMEVEIFNEHEVVLNANETYAKVREDLVRMLNNENGSVVIPELFPNCILIPSKDEPRVINELKFETNTNKSKKSEYRDINITLNKDAESYWWTVSEINQPYKFLDVEVKDKVVLLLFNDRVFPDSLQFLSGYGIVGLYSTFVFVVSRFIRGFFDDLSFKVIYTHLPCVRKVLQLCLDIYLVRESGEFELEEDLYAKLIFLYRSPETLIAWSRVDRSGESFKKLNDSEAKA